MYLPNRPLHEKERTAPLTLTLDAEDENLIFCFTGMFIISTKQASTDKAF